MGKVKVRIYGLLISIFIAVVPYVIGWIIGVDTIISPSLAETILLTLIQVNATLIGFFGVIMVFHLREFSNQIEMVRAKALEAIEKRDLIECDIKDNESDPAMVTKLQRRWDVYNDISNSLTKWIRSIARDRSLYGNNSIYPVAGFVLSILLSVVSLTKIDNNGLDSLWFTWVLLPLFFGIVILALGLGSSPPPANPKLDNIKTESE